jgi:type IV secretion system protein VirB10
MIDMNSNEQILGQEPRPTTGLPLQVNKKFNFKLIGLAGLIIAVIGMNFFIKPGAQQKVAVKPAVNDTYQTDSVDPLNGKSLSDSAAKSATLETDQLKQQIEEAKAKDFISRLQSPQNTDVVNTTNNTVANRGTTEMASASSSSSGLVGQQAIGLSEMSHDPNTAFLASASQSSVETAYANRLRALPYLITQGKFIFATLETAINSDLPGQVRAVINQDIYAEQGRRVLIPQGSRLVGEYKSGLVNNQSRLFVVWTRVIEPNGVNVMIGSEGTDALGRAGLTGTVDYHFLARFGTATLLSLIGAGASTIGVSPMDRDNSLAVYRQSVTQAMAQQANSTLSQQMDIPPTIHIPQGEKVVVFVNRDLDFSRVIR